MSRASALLRPDEEVVFRNSPGPVWLGLPLAGLCLAGLIWLGYALYRGEVAAVDWTYTLALLPLLTLFLAWYAHRPDIIVAGEQVLRSAGLLRGKAEVIAREDIAEIRFQGWHTGILTRAPGQLRMTLPNDMAIVDGRVWFPVPGLGWQGEHRKSVTTSRAARLARYERLLSRRYGEPLSCAGLAGPEACNGGWIK